MSRTLHLVLKSKWYDKIDSGNKTSEYREIKPYWNKIFYPPCRKKNGIIDTTMCEIISTGIFDNVVFHRGYTLQTIAFKIKKIHTIKGQYNDLLLRECWEIELGQRITKGGSNE